MGLDDRVRQNREDYVQSGQQPVPSELSGVTKEKVAETLALIDRATPEMIDVVYALLDDRYQNLFSRAPATARFRDGATVAHIATHVGILQRNAGRLDREGRDYWLKPLWEIGAVEKVYFDPKTKSFVPGHPVAKSPNNAYRLSARFAAILAMKTGREDALRDWISDDQTRIRLSLQAKMAKKAASRVGSRHKSLIEDCVSIFATHFLPNYRVLYVDDSDGDRIAEKESQILAAVGIELGIADAMPDVLLCDEASKSLWVIEAVTSDGEVDLHKVEQLTALAKRSGYESISFTTAYPTWRVAAARQGKYKNIALGTYIWIAEDPSKHLELHSN
ncbi:MAG: hypothetical protein EA381_13000 [Planctomycetaceae bacterium]|nr:MAG: hypothetical protein EA381_13000 [Planctomycetaceae bacterium]